MAHIMLYALAALCGFFFACGAFATVVRVALGFPDDGSATFALSFLAIGSVLFNIGTVISWLERSRP